jgi:hypothetical protein
MPGPGRVPEPAARFGSDLAADLQRPQPVTNLIARGRFAADAKKRERRRVLPPRDRGSAKPAAQRHIEPALHELELFDRPGCCRRPRPATADRVSVGHTRSKPRPRAEVSERERQRGWFGRQQALNVADENVAFLSWFRLEVSRLVGFFLFDLFRAAGLRADVRRAKTGGQDKGCRDASVRHPILPADWTGKGAATA